MNEVAPAAPPVVEDNTKYEPPTADDIRHIPFGELVPICKEFEIPDLKKCFICFETNGELGIRISDVLSEKEGAIDDPEKTDFDDWGHRQCHLDIRVRHYLSFCK